MIPKEINFKDMKDLKYGNIIIIKDPIFEEGTPYVLMSNIEDKSFYFINKGGASLMVNCQETIDSFNVRLINNTHPSWDQELSEHGSMMGNMLSEFEGMDKNDPTDI